MHTRTAISVVAVMLLSAGAAFADSDFYYCAARGYIAYETRLGVTPPQHELHIVRFGSRGIVAAAPIALDEFQVHGMTCGARLVRRASNRPGSAIVSARQLFAGVFLETID